MARSNRLLLPRDQVAGVLAERIRLGEDLVAMEDVAVRSDLARGDLIMRYGLHWGTTLYIGQITTVGRTEVTALGDEVNECARIEACATGGRTLASKHLIDQGMVPMVRR